MSRLQTDSTEEVAVPVIALVVPGEGSHGSIRPTGSLWSSHGVNCQPSLLLLRWSLILCGLVGTGKKILEAPSRPFLFSILGR